MVLLVMGRDGVRFPGCVRVSRVGGNPILANIWAAPSNYRRVRAMGGRFVGSIKPWKELLVLLTFEYSIQTSCRSSERRGEQPLTSRVPDHDAARHSCRVRHLSDRRDAGGAHPDQVPGARDPGPPGLRGGSAGKRAAPGTGRPFRKPGDLGPEPPGRDPDLERPDVRTVRPGAGGVPGLVRKLAGAGHPSGGPGGRRSGDAGGHRRRGALPGAVPGHPARRGDPPHRLQRDGDPRCRGPAGADDRGEPGPHRAGGG